MPAPGVIEAHCPTGRAGLQTIGQHGLLGQVVTLVAQHPAFDPGPLFAAHIDLVHHHLAALGVEGVEGSQLRDGPGRWPLPLVSLVIPLQFGLLSPALRLRPHLGSHTPDHCLERHPGLGESVVWQQPAVRHELERVLLLDPTNQSEQEPHFLLVLLLHRC